MMDYTDHTNKSLLTASPHDFLQALRNQPELSTDKNLANRKQHILKNASVCSFCGVGCPYTVENDKKGRPKVLPLSDLGLCVKGQTSLVTGGYKMRAERLAKKGLPDDRIRTPMIRGHDGQMKAVSWDDALDRAAWLFLHAREWVGPQAIAIYGNGQKTLEDIWLASLYKLVFNIPSIGANSEHCLTSAGAAHILNFGNEASFTWQRFDELATCDVAVLHGTNAFVTFPQAYEKLAGNTHCIKVVIDPVISDTVTALSQTDPRTIHIRFRQGGDVVFNIAVARIILENNWQDDAAIAKTVSAESFLAFKHFCFSPRFDIMTAAKSIACPGQNIEALAATIRHHAALLAAPANGYRPRVAFVSSMGINQSTGSYGFSTNLNLLLLTGNVGRKGAGSLRIAGQSNATSELMMGFNSRKLVFNLDPANDHHRQTLATLLNLPLDNIPNAVGTPVARMSEDDSLYCFIFIGTQMTKNMPRVGHWARRMGRAFNIVIDSFLADGVLEHADVLLPALTYTERTGVIQRGDRTLQLQQPLTEAPEQAWSDSQILARLALKIAERLTDPDTAALNRLSASTVQAAFARYMNRDGQLDAAAVFDHIVAVNRQLGVYSKLETAEGQALSHHLLREHAGTGIQWGGDGRYQDSGDFPGLFGEDRQKATLVVPPDDFLQRLQAPLTADQLFLISGRGRPGRNALQGRARYNSGIKTLPVYGTDPDQHYVEMHPTDIARLRLSENDTVKLFSAHGAVIATVAVNTRIPCGAVFMDFVPGEVNRLTDFVDADQMTHQSLIKRTRVKLEGLSVIEKAIWLRPKVVDLSAITLTLFEYWRRQFPHDQDWIASQKSPCEPDSWLPSRLFEQPASDAEADVSHSVGAFIVFFQRYSTSADYRTQAGEALRMLSAERRTQFLRIFLPLIRRLDYQSVMHPLLAEFVGTIRLVDNQGALREINLLSAHKAAVLEFKEEIVAIQLYVAIKRGLELLFGPGTTVAQDRLAFVSGVAIPCAGDVPAHILDCSPADLSAATLVHSRAIGSSALMVIDKWQNRAVRVNVTTGVLPKDKELGYLRGVVINRKKEATAHEHRRFFDRLGELIVDYIRTGDDNFALHGPTDFPWQEYQTKFAFAPANIQRFGEFLLAKNASANLAKALLTLGVLDPKRDSRILKCLAENTAEDVHHQNIPAVDFTALYQGTLAERVKRVVDTVIAPVLENDGGRLDVLDINESTGELQVRFVGSCANCPYSLLSMEQIVKPSLAAIPGVTRITHRAKMKDKELIAVTLV